MRARRDDARTLADAISASFRVICLCNWPTDDWPICICSSSSFISSSTFFRRAAAVAAAASASRSAVNIIACWSSSPESYVAFCCW